MVKAMYTNTLKDIPTSIIWLVIKVLKCSISPTTYGNMLQLRQQFFQGATAFKQSIKDLVCGEVCRCSNYIVPLIIQ
jgi:hypothetical protein